MGVTLFTYYENLTTAGEHLKKWDGGICSGTQKWTKNVVNEWCSIFKENY